MAEKLSEISIVVFETNPFWGPELQRQFLNSGVTVRECRSVGDLIPSVRDLEQALLILDLTAGLVDCLKWLEGDFARYPREIQIIALGSAETHDLEWLLREAGVNIYLPELIGGEALARICRRQLNLGNPFPFAITTLHRT